MIEPEKVWDENLDFDLYTAEDWEKHGVEYIISNVAIYPWNKLYRTDIIKDNGLKYEDVVGEDITFNFSYYDYAGRIKCIPDVFYNYNHMGQGESNKAWPQFYNILKSKFEMFNKLAVKRGIGDKIKKVTEEMYPKVLYYFFSMNISKPNKSYKLKERKEHLKELYNSGRDDIILKEYLKNDKGWKGALKYNLYRFRMSTAMIVLNNINYQLKSRGKNE